MSAPADDDRSPVAPLRRPVFRMLGITWLVTNVCMWMTEVVAAWMTTSLTTKLIWMALVQTVATLPVFLLGLPSDAVARVFCRRAPAPAASGTGAERVSMNARASLARWLLAR